MTDRSPLSLCAHTTLAVLAGGEGTRMGTPKGNLTLGARPILHRLLDRLNWPGPTLLVTAPGRQHPPGYRLFTHEATDPVPNQGPLRGILTALENSTTNEVLVLPVDMPNITPAPLGWLAARLQAHPTAAAVMLEQPGHPNRVEPFPAAFRAPIAQPLLRAHLKGHQLALHQLTENSQVVVVPVPSDWPSDFWLNLNTPSDLATYHVYPHPW